MRTSTKRLLASAGALLFIAAFFALPLYAAASLCTMPCCHHAKSATLSDGAPGCAANCTLHTADATTEKSVSVATPQSRTIVSVPACTSVAAVDAMPAAHLAPDLGPPHPAAAPLHVLNSIFRI